MITAQKLGSLAIRRVIFHDIPRNLRGVTTAPVLSDVETTLDRTRQNHLRIRLTRALGSKATYPIVFNPATSSPLPGHVRVYSSATPSPDDFVKMSQQLANHLFEQQHGAVSPGLLCVLDVASGSMPGLVVLKLEREEGARLQLKETLGKKTFHMSVLDNLVLTDSTRLFKSAMFLRTGSGNDAFDAIACDTQLSITSSDEMAKFWLRFLGCEFTIESRVATQRFFDSTRAFINDIVTDPVDKSDLYEHLLSHLKDNKRTISPRSFIEQAVPRKYQKSITEHFGLANIPLVRFDKNLADIEGKLRRKAYHTTHGATVSVTEESASLVEVTADQIVIRDTLEKFN